ncbi:MAG: SRPBCC family protein [Gemmatimonadaceae bacterium]
MATHRLACTLHLPLPLDRVFPFFADAENLARITPPELGFEICSPLPVAMHEGARIDYRISVLGLPLRWRTLITIWNPPFEFVDEQVRGPYALWRHHHRFHAEGPESTRVEDEVTYRLPFSPLGDVALPLVKRQLARIFSFRTAAVRRLLLEAAA